MAMPITVTNTAETIAITAVVCTAARIFERSPCPMRMAIVAFVPIETPTKKLMNSATKGDTPPIAASSVEPRRRPATMASVELNSCWKMLEKASGMAKRKSLPTSGPCSMSMLLRFAFFSTVFCDDIRNPPDTSIACF